MGKNIFCYSNFLDLCWKIEKKPQYNLIVPLKFTNFFTLKVKIGGPTDEHNKNEFLQY